MNKNIFVIVSLLVILIFTGCITVNVPLGGGETAPSFQWQLEWEPPSETGNQLFLNPLRIKDLDASGSYQITGIVVKHSDGTVAESHDANAYVGISIINKHLEEIHELLETDNVTVSRQPDIEFKDTVDLETQIEATLMDSNATNVSVTHGSYDNPTNTLTSAFLFASTHAAVFEWDATIIPDGALCVWSATELQVCRFVFNAGTLDSTEKIECFGGFLHICNYDVATYGSGLVTCMLSTNGPFTANLVKVNSSAKNKLTINNITRIIGSDEKSIDSSNLDMINPDTELVTRGYLEAHPGTIEVENGIEYHDSKLKLGGTLTRNTVINSTNASANSSFELTMQNSGANTAEANPEVQLVTMGGGIGGNEVGTSFVSNMYKFRVQHSDNANNFDSELELENDIYMRIRNASNEIRIDLHQTNGLLFTDDIYNKGAKYDGDYEPNFEDRSLVTKQYVDAEILDASETPDNITIASEYLKPIYGGDSDVDALVENAWEDTDATGGSIYEGSLTGGTHHTFGTNNINNCNDTMYIRIGFTGSQRITQFSVTFD